MEGVAAGGNETSRSPAKRQGAAAGVRVQGLVSHLSHKTSNQEFTVKSSDFEVLELWQSIFSCTDFIWGSKVPSSSEYLIFQFWPQRSKGKLVVGNSGNVFPSELKENYLSLPQAS